MAKQDITTDEAFEMLVSSPYYWSLTKLPNNQRRQWSIMVRNGKGISTDKKTELLEKAGFAIEQVTLWKLPD